MPYTVSTEPGGLGRKLSKMAEAFTICTSIGNQNANSETFTTSVNNGSGSVQLKPRNPGTRLDCTTPQPKIFDLPFPCSSITITGIIFYTSSGNTEDASWTLTSSFPLNTRLTGLTSKYQVGSHYFKGLISNKNPWYDTYGTGFIQFDCPNGICKTYVENCYVMITGYVDTDPPYATTNISMFIRIAGLIEPL